MSHNHGNNRTMYHEHDQNHYHALDHNRNHEPYPWQSITAPWTMNMTITMYITTNEWYPQNITMTNINSANRPCWWAGGGGGGRVVTSGIMSARNGHNRSRPMLASWFDWSLWMWNRLRIEYRNTWTRSILAKWFDWSVWMSNRSRI